MRLIGLIMDDLFTQEELDEMMKPFHVRFEELKDCDHVYLFGQKMILENILIRDRAHIAKLYDLRREGKVTVYNIMLLTKECKPWGGKHSSPIPVDYKSYIRIDSLSPKFEKEYNENNYHDYFEDMREREFARWY